MNCPKCGNNIDDIVCNVCGFDLKKSKLYRVFPISEEALANINEFIKEKESERRAEAVERSIKEIENSHKKWMDSLAASKKAKEDMYQIFDGLQSEIQTIKSSLDIEYQSLIRILNQLGDKQYLSPEALYNLQVTFEKEAVAFNKSSNVLEMFLTKADSEKKKISNQTLILEIDQMIKPLLDYPIKTRVLIENIRARIYR